MALSTCMDLLVREWDTPLQFLHKDFHKWNVKNQQHLGVSDRPVPVIFHVVKVQEGSHQSVDISDVQKKETKTPKTCHTNPIVVLASSWRSVKKCIELFSLWIQNYPLVFSRCVSEEADKNTVLQKESCYTHLKPLRILEGHIEFN